VKLIYLFITIALLAFFLVLMIPAQPTQHNETTTHPRSTRL